jgi:tRNA(fMet)-specific endonuclease VapC
VAQLVDTTVFIALERNQASVDMLLSRLPDEPIAIATVTAAELLTGVHRANTSERRRQREAFVERILDTFPVLPLDLPAARVYAALLANLQMHGTPVGAHDLQIAAIAMASGFGVATHNVRDFARIPGLTVHDMTDL